MLHTLHVGYIAVSIPSDSLINYLKISAADRSTSSNSQLGTDSAHCITQLLRSWSADRSVSARLIGWVSVGEQHILLTCGTLGPQQPYPNLQLWLGLQYKYVYDCQRHLDEFPSLRLGVRGL